METGRRVSRRGSRTPLILCAVMVLATVCLLAGRVAWWEAGAASEEGSISPEPVAQQTKAAEQDEGGAPRTAAQAGVECEDFGNQEQAQAVFEQDEIIYGDALDADVNGIACDEGDSFSSPSPPGQPRDEAPPEPGDAQLLQAGGPNSGPVPPVPNSGSCPEAFPVRTQDGAACFAPDGPT